MQPLSGVFSPSSASLVCARYQEARTGSAVCIDVSELTTPFFFDLMNMVVTRQKDSSKLFGGGGGGGMSAAERAVAGPRAISLTVPPFSYPPAPYPMFHPLSHCNSNFRMAELLQNVPNFGEMPKPMVVKPIGTCTATQCKGARS
jgi:hypothetical protein